MMMRTTLLSLSAMAALWGLAAQPAHARSDFPDLAFAAPTAAPAPLLVGTNQANGETRNPQTPARRAPREARRESAPPQQQAQRPVTPPPRVLPCPPDELARVCRRGGGSDPIPDSALMRQRIL